jgi:retinol dehydrogenase 12
MATNQRLYFCRSFCIIADQSNYRIQVNHLSTSLLAFRLVPRLLETAKERNTISRLTVVGSGLHYWAKIPEAALQSPNIFEKLSDPSYCTST